MVITSICDPALFDPALFDPAQMSNRYYPAGLKTILQDMVHNHIPVFDAEGEVAKAIQDRLRNIPSLQPLYNSLPPERIARISVNPEHAKKMQAWLDPGSSIAAACSADPLVDVLIASADTQTALQEERFGCSKLCSVEDYPDSCWKKKKTQTEKAIPIGGMSRSDFIDKIIRPVVRCAQQVTIIDKIIIKAAFGDDRTSTGAPSRNWDGFRKSIKAVYDEWSAGPSARSGVFQVVTWPVTHVQKGGAALLGNDLAAELGQRLGIPFNRLRIIFKSEQSFRADMHDRYLVTNQGFVLGFSKGFDLFASDKLDVCDVYLRNPDELLRRLMSKTNNSGILEPV